MFMGFSSTTPRVCLNQLGYRNADSVPDSTASVEAPNSGFLLHDARMVGAPPQGTAAENLCFLCDVFVARAVT